MSTSHPLQPSTFMNLRTSNKMIWLYGCRKENDLLTAEIVLFDCNPNDKPVLIDQETGKIVCKIAFPTPPESFAGGKGVNTRYQILEWRDDSV